MTLLCGKTRLRVRFSFALLFTFLCWKRADYLLCFLAALLHEGGHLTAMLCCGLCPSEISLDICGISIVRRGTVPLSLRQEIAVALAGPAVNGSCCGLLALFGGAPSSFFYFHLGLALLNLLPMEGLDGGNLLYCLLERRMLPTQAARRIKIITAAILFPTAAAGFFILIRSGYNLTLLLVCLYATVTLLRP